MNTLELMASEENLIRALNEDILPSNKNLVYLYDLLMAQESTGTVAIDGCWEIVLQFSQMNGIGVSQSYAVHLSEQIKHYLCDDIVDNCYGIQQFLLK